MPPRTYVGDRPCRAPEQGARKRGTFCFSTRPECPLFFLPAVPILLDSQPVHLTAMTGHNALRVTTIILRQFRRYGCAGQHTMPFDELPTAVRADLGEELQFDPEELPIVAHYRSQNDWSVLTTRRLVSRQESTVRSIAWSDFANFEVDLKAVAHLPDPIDELGTLTVLTTDGRRIRISTDCGPPFLAFWNSLIMAKRMAAEEERRRGASD